MAIREIHKLKDEILRKKCREVENIDDRIEELIQDMKDTMYKYDGIGLAANQVGVLKQILVYDDKWFDDGAKKSPKVLINPKIIKYSKNLITTEEGCLSFPDIFGYVDRPQKITVEAFNERMEKIKFEAKDMEAVVIQHEYDHLQGKVFVDMAYDVYVGEKPEEEKNTNRKSSKKDSKSKNNRKVE